MCNGLPHLVFVCVVCITLVLFDQTPAKSYEVYYVSVGNSEYRDGKYSIQDANESARQVAQYLHRAGAVDGITLVSEQNTYVTHDDVMSVLTEIASKAKGAKNPLVVYYFIGHGEAGPGEKHVSLVGYYKQSDPTEVVRSRGIIETREVGRLLEKQELPYILILDNCYSSAPAEGLQLLSRAINKKMFGIADGIDRMNPNFGKAQKLMIEMVLYAAKPGHFVRTLKHPWYEQSIGPLGRRLLLLLNAAIKSEKELSVGRFLEQMNDPAFDPTSAVGHHTMWTSGSGLLDVTPSSPAVYGMDQRLGGALILPGSRARPAESAGLIRKGSGHNVGQ